MQNLSIVVGDKVPELMDIQVPIIWVVRVYFSSRQQLAEITAWIEPWEVNYKEGYLVVGASQNDYSRLLAQGLRLDIDQKYTQRVNRPMEYLPNQVSGIPGFACYRTVEETYSTAQEIAANFPSLAAWVDIGDSWEKITPGGLPGYDLMVLKLTNSAITIDKPKLFIMSAVHAREFATAELITRFAEYMIENYDTDPDISWLLDYTEIYLLLHANPDGRKQAEMGLPWRKNTNENYCSPTSTSRGADLNRNFEFQWNCCGGSSGSQCDVTYRGPSPASEPETDAIQNYVRAIFPDQRGNLLTDPAAEDAMGLFLDIHSYGELVLWPWGFTATEAPNGIALQTLGRKFAYFNYYHPEQAIRLYPTDGTTVDFAYGELGLAAYAFELGTTFLQSCPDFENIILPNNIQALIYAAKTSRTPFMSPAGPDVLEVIATPNILKVGDVAILDAYIDDTRFSNDNGTEPSQNITAAEYSIDTPPWESGAVTYPLSATDGSFNNSKENVTAVLNTADLSIGRHIVFLRSKDEDGNWGAVSAVFIYLIDPETTPMLQGFVRDAISGIPLAATVSANNIFNTSTNLETGFYQMYVISGIYDIKINAAGYGEQIISNLMVNDGQIISQDIALYPICTVFIDDVESGNIGWTAQSPWEITAEKSHSPSYSWSVNPGEGYDNYLDISLTSPMLNLKGLNDIHLDFWHICDTEAIWDICHVEISKDGGNSWTETSSFNGAQTQWENVILPLTTLDNQPEARIRFRFTSDQYFSADGWHIDDIRITGSGTDCIAHSPKFFYLPIVQVR